MRYAMENCTKTVMEHENGPIVKMDGESTAGRPFSVIVRLSDLNRWLNGELIQVAFPYLSADEREVCMTGFDSQTWDEMFPSSEDNE